MTRDDLFTHIHKALRKGLFDLAVRAGATDWTDPDDVGALTAAWAPLAGLLRAHTRHEDEHILRLLDGVPASGAEPLGEVHDDLDALLDDLDIRLAALARRPHPDTGLGWYRDLCRFVAATLPHLHEEETVVMPQIWQHRTDDEIAATRARFMAAVPPDQFALTMELLLPALDRTTRLGLVAGLAATAPPAVVEAVLAIARRLLGAEDAAGLRAVVAPAAGDGDGRSVA